jgi:hypothetical protein
MESGTSASPKLRSSPCRYVVICSEHAEISRAKSAFEAAFRALFFFGSN